MLFVNLTMLIHQVIVLGTITFTNSPRHWFSFHMKGTILFTNIYPLCLQLDLHSKHDVSPCFKVLVLIMNCQILKILNLL